MHQEEVGKMEPLALIRRIASLIHELVAPRYRPELHYMRGPGPACRRRLGASGNPSPRSR
jgi:hypothetical protein